MNAFSVQLVYYSISPNNTGPRYKFYFVLFVRKRISQSHIWWWWWWWWMGRGTIKVLLLQVPARVIASPVPWSCHALRARCVAPRARLNKRPLCRLESRNTLAIKCDNFINFSTLRGPRLFVFREQMLEFGFVWRHRKSILNPFIV